MPGIVGIVNRGLAPDTANRQVAEMVECMRHERFYTSGTCSFPNLGIHAGWIAHEGSMAADQVFWNEGQDVALLFAGECFVDSEVRTHLKRQGHELGDAAGDWLVHLYEEKEEGFFQSLNGLFSGLLLDLRNQRGYLFNDRYGIERLYWFEAGEATYFATEAKALLRVLPQLREFDPEGVTDFLAFGCTLEWRTLFKGMHLAPGGSLWRIENGECRKSRYFDPTEWESLPILPDEAFQARFQETFTRLLPRYFASDSEVGVSLTGGLDTRMIMAALPSETARPVTYTFCGANPELRDARIASRVAAACGLRHEVIHIETDFLSNFADLADRTVWVTDGCFGPSGAHEIYLNRKARALSPIRLTGNFGSEILRSMSTLKPLNLASELISPDLVKVLDSSVSPQHGERTHRVTFAAFEEVPWNLFGSLAAGRSQVTFRTPYLDNEIVALGFQAPDSVRTSVTSAVEYVQHANPRLGEIPTDRGEGTGNSTFKQTMQKGYAEVSLKMDYYCSEGLPFGLAALDPLFQWTSACLGIKGQHKFLSYRNWLRRELADYATTRLEEASRLSLPFIEKGSLRTLARDHIAGRRNRTREINAVLTLEAIDRLLLNRTGQETPGVTNLALAAMAR